MSAMSTDEGIQPEVTKSDENACEQPASTSPASTSALQNGEPVKESETKSDETKETATDQKVEPDRPKIPDLRVWKSKYKSEDLMKASYLHCPFVWQKDLNIPSYNDHDIDLLSSTEEMFDDAGFRFRSFIVNLVLCYHKFYKRNIDGCIQHLDTLENMMRNSSRKDNHDYLFNHINDALYHVIHSCRIYILQTTNQIQKAEQVLTKIKSFDSMSDSNRAGLWAIRANVYVEYGYEGVRSAVTYINNAVMLDPQNAFWHFMKGMFMGRLRRLEGGLVMPKNEEFQALRTAIDKREDASFIAFAAEAYSETAKIAKKLYMQKLKQTEKDIGKLLAGKLQELNEVAAKYFKTSVSLKPKSSHLLFRCGKGLINLAPPYQDIKMGLDFIRKGLEIAPQSGYGNHAMAMYLEKIEKNPTLAKEYLDVSVRMKNFPAHVDMVRIEFLESRNSEKLWEALEELLDQYSEMPRRRKILGEIVCYYLFVNYDLVEACFYMRKLIQMNSSSFDVINSVKSMILPISSPIPLSDLILNQIKACLEDRKLEQVSRDIFKKYIQFLVDEDIATQKLPDTAFSKIQSHIEQGFKNKKMKPVAREVLDSQKRVHGAHEFEADPCAEDEPEYLNFYKNDLRDAGTRAMDCGEGGEMTREMLRQLGQNPLPKRCNNRDRSLEGERHSRESSRSSRRHCRRDRSVSSSGSSDSSSDRRSSQKHRNRRRSYSYSSSSSDRHSRSHKRSSRRRYSSSEESSSSTSSSSSYDSKRSHNKHRRHKPSKAKKNSKHRRRRSPSSSSTSSSESSPSSRASSIVRRSTHEDRKEKPVSARASVEATTVPSQPSTNPSQPSDHVPKVSMEVSVSNAQAAMAELSISSGRSSPQQKAGSARREAEGAEAASQNDGDTGKSEDSKSIKKSSKPSADRGDSDGSVRTRTSRTSAASRKSKRRSRDRSVESVRTTCSRSSKKEGKSSRRQRYVSASSSRSSSTSPSSLYSDLDRKKSTKGSSGRKDEHGWKSREKSSPERSKKRSTRCRKDSGSTDSGSSSRPESVTGKKTDRHR